MSAAGAAKLFRRLLLTRGMPFTTMTATYAVVCGGLFRLTEWEGSPKAATVGTKQGRSKWQSW